jgi:hypothetical protein
MFLLWHTDGKNVAQWNKKRVNTFSPPLLRLVLAFGALSLNVERITSEEEQKGVMKTSPVSIVPLRLALTYGAHSLP